MINKSFFRYLYSNQIIVALAVIAVAWILFELIGVVIAGFIAYIIMAAISPVVDVLAKRKIPKALGAAMVYLLIVVVLVLLIFPLVPFFSNQTMQLVKGLPLYIHNATELLGINASAKELQDFLSSQLGAIGTNALQVTGKVFGGIFTVLTIIVLSFYLLLDHTRVQKSIASLFSPSVRGHARDTIEKVEDKLGAWLRGQILLSFVVGFVTWVGLTLIGVEYALPLALLAGLLEIVPTIGPIIAAIPAMIVALSISPTVAVLVAILYAIIQVLENNFLVPRIMQRAVGLHPIIVILGIIIGGKLLGVLGALLAVPFISLIVVITREINKSE
jgi:predicted PurR-regulated permease PerM